MEKGKLLFLAIRRWDHSSKLCKLVEDYLHKDKNYVNSDCATVNIQFNII